MPQQLAAGDIYPALEKGTLDAAEWVGPYDDEKLGFYKVAKYYYYPGWWEGCGQAHNIINLAKWNELPKNYQAAIRRRRAMRGPGCSADTTTLNPAALKRLLAGGAQLRAFPQDVMEACYKAANEIYADLSKTNPMFKKMYDSLVAVPQQLLSLDAGRGRRLRQLHDPDAHAHLTRPTGKERQAPEAASGACFLPYCVRLIR